MYARHTSRIGTQEPVNQKLVYFTAMNLFECQKDLSGNNQLTLFTSPVPNFKYMIFDKTSQIRLLTLHFSYNWLAVTNTYLTIFSLSLPTPVTKYSSKYSLSTIFTCS